MHQHGMRVWYSVGACTPPNLALPILGKLVRLGNSPAEVECLCVTEMSAYFDKPL